MNLKLNKIILLIAFSLCLIEAHSQFNNFKKWSVKGGLLQSDIYNIKQDSRGFIWIASGGGVSFFDGVKFKHYTKKNGLAGNVVRCIFEDSQQRIWFGTNEGVCYFDGLIFRKIVDKNFQGTTSLCIGEDMNHKIFVGTDDGGLNILSFENDSISIRNFNESNGLSSNSVFDIVIDSNQNVWLATYGGGLIRLKAKNGEFEILQIRGKDKLLSDNLFSLALDESYLYVGSEDAGLFKFQINNLEQNNYKAIQIINDQNGLGSNNVWDILITKDKKLWAASLDNGITRLETSKSKSTNISFHKANGLSDNQILCLYEDRQHNVWIGTNGNGINLFTGDYFSHYNSANGLPSNKILAIQQDSTNGYWLATSGAGLTQLQFHNNIPVFKSYIDKNKLTDYITCIAIGKSANKNIWFGTESNGIVKFKDSKFFNYTEKDGLINNRVYSINVDTKGIVWIGTSDGISRFDGVKFLNISTEKMKMQNEGVKTIVEDNANTIWFGTSGGLARYKGDGDLRTFDEVEGLKSKDVNVLASNKQGDVFIGTNSGGLYKFNHSKNDSNAIELVIADSLLSSNSIRSMGFLDDHTLILGYFHGFDKITFSKDNQIENIKHYSEQDGFLGVECNDNSLLLDNNHNLWFGTVNGITKYNSKSDNKVATEPKILITDVQLFFKDIEWSTKNTSKLPWFNLPKLLILPFSDNHLTFKFISPAYDNANSLSYKYKLEGRDKDWSPFRKSREETFSGLSPGTYTFMVVAQNEAGLLSKPAKFTFVITPPWYKTKTFYFILILVIFLLVYGYIKWREKKLVKEKELLEIVVNERTQEVVAQKHVIEEKHKEITDSINYAERIQRSFLATKDLLDDNLNNIISSSDSDNHRDETNSKLLDSARPDNDFNQDESNYFVFFRPKDVVSGDFYWADVLNNGQFILATADSTGHGVPGAIMSLLNITSLEKAVENLNDPAEILNHTRQTIIKRLKKDGSEQGGKDGMDCTLICFDFNNKQLRIAAANNPVWIVRALNNDDNSKEVIEIKPDKMPVGKHDKDQESFTSHTIEFKKGDVIYALTDGFPDQFGGEKGKKFMSKNLREYLLGISHLPMKEQKTLLEQKFLDWVGALEQVDDVTLIGIRV